MEGSEEKAASSEKHQLAGQIQVLKAWPSLVLKLSAEQVANKR